MLAGQWPKYKLGLLRRFAPRNDKLRRICCHCERKRSNLDQLPQIYLEHAASFHQNLKQGRISGKWGGNRDCAVCVSSLLYNARFYRFPVVADHGFL
jgi:hypothetical protein